MSTELMESMRKEIGQQRDAILYFRKKIEEMENGNSSPTFISSQLENDIKNMNDRMDSFVDQIADLKRFFHEKSKESVNELICKFDEYIPHIENTVNIEEYQDAMLTRIIELEDEVKKKIDDKKLDHQKFKKEMGERMDSLESYIKKEKFHEVLSGLEELEEEYQAKAFELVNKIAKKRSKK